MNMIEIHSNQIEGIQQKRHTPQPATEKKKYGMIDIKNDYRGIMFPISTCSFVFFFFIILLGNY